MLSTLVTDTPQAQQGLDILVRTTLVACLNLNNFLGISGLVVIVEGEADHEMLLHLVPSVP
jgi:hypothetical protein